MSIKVGINGFGRIGQVWCSRRMLIELTAGSIEVVGINDLIPTPTSLGLHLRQV